MKRYVREFANDRIRDIKEYRDRLQRDVDAMTADTESAEYIAQYFNLDNFRSIIAGCNDHITKIAKIVKMCEYGYISECGAVAEIAKY